MLRLINLKFNLLYFTACAIAFAIVCIRNYSVPFAHDEVATFYYYIQSESFLPFSSHIDANGHFLNSFLSWICFKLFGSSEFALRLPELVALFVLIYAVYKYNSSFQSLLSKLILTGGFILSFNILNFYSLCRGYGLSMAFLLLGFYYFFTFLKNNQFKHLLFSFICLQFALSANLTLVFVLLLAAAIAFVTQLKNKSFFSIKNISLYIIHFSLILFWIKYAFYLQENGALYYGGGQSYWVVTFQSLIDTVFVKSNFIYVFILLIFLFLTLFWLYNLIKNKLAFLFESSFAISMLILLSLICAFYILKLLFHINYPEDRTGLFFYVLFILSIAFYLDEYENKTNILFISLPLYFIIHLIININFSKHAWGFYETMPKLFYETLLAEQNKSDRLITIGGHRVLELFYSFYNYNSPSKLNHMLPPEEMHMNCDYYVTWKKDKPYYDNYYSEIDSDQNWNLVLLKRKATIERIPVYTLNEPKEINGNDEFYSFFERVDTLITSSDPILVEIDFDVDKLTPPANMWLVLQVDSAYAGPNTYFRRTPLNWVKYNWTGTKNFKTSIQTDNLPLQHCRIAAFLWNIDKKEIKLKINKLTLYKLKAEGITKKTLAIE